ncbi:DUF4148 domain-containing protein [Pandoraea anhela]|uniref:Purine nucleoside phosphorylase n=1 Tax=Pandoraea anhela TaxID=2508295 RepID=A0A5E4S1J3_9BURK|nr:DUF4148 domain-containing protein [Pandoraea anhela]VVD69666.1 hypothetical protein PAN31108_00557 [Pandoraea anhela]
MKTSILATTTAILLAASSVAMAAPQTGKTRAEVRAELKALQDAGYTAAGDSTRYPANLQKAQAKLAKSSMERSQPATGVATGDAMSSMPAASMPPAYRDKSRFDATFRGQ